MARRTDFDFDAVINEDAYDGYGMNRSNCYSDGFVYRILPLESPSIRKQSNDKDRQRSRPDEEFYVGKRVKGYSLKDNKVHRGRIQNFVWDTENPGTVKAVVIQDEEHNTPVKLTFNSIEIIERERMKKYFDIDSIVKQTDCNAVDESAQYDLFSQDDWTADDSIYRDEVLSHYHIPEMDVKYWDAKFSGYFKEREIRLDKISSANILFMMAGVDNFFNKTEAVRAAKKFLCIYCGLTGQTASAKINSMRVEQDEINYTYTSPDQAAVVSSWFHVWAFLKSLHRMNVMLRQTDGFSETLNYEWVYKPNSFMFRKNAVNLAVDVLVKIPDVYVTPDGKEKKLYNLSSL